MHHLSSCQTHAEDFRRMGCCNPEGLKQLGGTTVAKWQAATGGSLFFTGLAMLISGIGILASDCPEVNKPWVLLVYGLVTMLTYVWPMLAGIDRWIDDVNCRAKIGIIVTELILL